MRWMALIALALPLVGCDKAKGAYDNCARLAGTATVQKANGGPLAELRKSFESARAACEQATTLDADSASGKAALANVPELINEINEINGREQSVQAAQEQAKLRAEQSRSARVS